VGANPTVKSISDPILAQSEDIWTGQWWYNIRNGECRLITEFDPASDKIKFEYAASLPIAYSAGPPEVPADTYEIHSIWNAFELHAAINRAIEDGYPSFFDIFTDETLVIKDHTLTYSMASFATAPWIITKIWIENPTSHMRGTATSATLTSVSDSGVDLSTAKAGWLVSIYDGTGAGQVRTVTSLTGVHQLNVAAWTVTPDSTSKYCVWDPSDQLNDWTRLQSVRFNAKESPTLFYLGETFSGHVGFRIRVEYISKPLVLATESASTSIPKEFILHKALSYLYGQKVNDNRADRQRYESLQQFHYQQAEIYRQAHAYNAPDTTIWSNQIESIRDYGVQGDPLGFGAY
jgi:hypothetical protein